MAMKKTNKQLVALMRSHRDLCGISSQTFNHDLPLKYRKAVEKYVQEKFLHWWDSWIEPDIAEVERRLIKPRRKKRV